MILTVSINTRNGFSQPGAPPGRSLAAKVIGLCRALEIIKDSHRGIPKDRVKIRCLENLNVYGRRPIKLIMMIIINREVIKEENLFRFIPDVRIVCEYIISSG